MKIEYNKFLKLDQLNGFECHGKIFIQFEFIFTNKISEFSSVFIFLFVFSFLIFWVRRKSHAIQGMEKCIVV